MDLIIDCYTDEPSGLGAPPYLSVHSRYLAGALTEKNIEYEYVTIDDLRFESGEQPVVGNSLNKRVINRVAKGKATEFLNRAKNIYVIMGCFVSYKYLSCEPPSFQEVDNLLNKYKVKDVILMYALGAISMSKKLIKDAFSPGRIKTVVLGNFYNYILFGETDDYLPHYDRLKIISVDSASILSKINRPLVMELESSIGCNRKPGCKFCIESIRGIKNTSREVTDIIDEVKSLYTYGAKYFRLGRQPNFYSFHDTDSGAVRTLLEGIREECLNIKMLHIDNVSPHNVNSKEGIKITEAIARFCTSGNIAPFGVESFDTNVRQINNLNGTVEDILKSIEIINYFGSQQEIDGTRRFLPGLNFIYGLEGQSERTNVENLKCLEKVFNNNYVRRVFVRNLTSPHGVQFDQSQYQGFTLFKNDIVESFSKPMLQKVYPYNTVLKDVRVEMVTNGDSILRKMGTCAERVVVKNIILDLDDFYDVKIIGYIDDRTLEGEII